MDQEEDKLQYVNNEETTQEEPKEQNYMDGYLKSNLDIAKNVIKKDWDMVVVIDGAEGCLSGDTIININRCSFERRYTLKHMFKQFHMQGEKSKSKMWNLDHPTYVRSYDGASIKLHKINDVVYSGKKEVWKIVLENGREIKVTFDHKIMTRNGWRELKDLALDDEIMCDTLRPQRGEQKSYKLGDAEIKVPNHPFKNKSRGTVEVHRLMFESYLNKIHFRDFLDILWNDKEAASTLLFVNPEVYVIHHIDGNHYNNSKENLEIINKNDHSLLHAKQDEAFKYFNRGIPVFSKLIKKDLVGIEKTYDIVCDEPHHNFVANGIVVHNSGKSVLGMQMAAYCDPTLTVDRIVFNPKDLKDKIMKAKPYQSIVYDEAYTGLSSRATMSLINRSLISMLAEIRQKNLFVFVIMPCFFDLDKYVALWRSRALIHVYTGKNFERGYFSFFNVQRKKQLYILGKKYYSYGKPRANFIGRFTNRYPIDEAEYKLKKRNSLVVREKTSEEKVLRKEVEDAIFERMMELGDTITNVLKIKILGIASTTFYDRARRWNEEKDLISSGCGDECAHTPEI